MLIISRILICFRPVPQTLLWRWHFIWECFRQTFEITMGSGSGAQVYEVSTLLRTSCDHDWWFGRFIDPTLEHDLKSTRPWALSPMVSTMPHFMHQRLHAACSSPLQSDDMEFESLIQAFPPAEPIKDQTLELSKALRDKTSSSSSAPSKICFNDAAARKSYFSSAAHRQAFVFGPSDVLTIDFCYGFLEFSPKLVLRIPGGLTFDLMHYWDGQMVQFVCCERKKPTNDQSADDGKPWGRVFWAISIEPYEDEEVMDKINWQLLNRKYCVSWSCITPVSGERDK